MRKILLFLLSLALPVALIHAQEVPRVIPSTPEQAALNKFGDIPVSYTSGIPNISVPIYTITTKNGLSIPISLGYHSSGIKVNDVASNVGLGWALKAGYSISVSTNGLNDLATDGMANGSTELIRPADFSPNSVSVNDLDYIYAKDVAEGNQDAQPDIYHYNIAGRSGKFVLDQNPAGITAHTIPFEPIKIDIVWIAGTATFNITDENGNLFKFNLVGKQSFKGNNGTPGHSEYTALLHNMPSTYYLTEIVTNDGEQINFTYSANGYNYKASETESKYVAINSGSSSFNFSDPLVESTMYMENGYYLSGISFQGGRGTVEFVYGSGRSDLPGASQLTGIKVKEDGTPVRDFNLNQGYFVSNPGTETRLKLNEVEGSLTGQKWTFGYETGVNLPPRFSTAQDFWGYYNGKLSNTSLIPAYVVNGVEQISGADRSVSDTYAKANILTSITYPTGGQTALEYESNDYHGFSHETGTVAHHKTGGLRVKKVTSTTGNQSLVTHYDYTDPITGNSSGDMLDRTVFTSVVERVFNNVSHAFRKLTTSSLFSLGNASGIAVNYEYVTTTKGDGSNGKTEYRHSLFKDIIYPNEKLTSNAHRRGDLLETKVYNDVGQVVSRTVNEYEFATDFTNGVHNHFGSVDPVYILAGLAINMTSAEWTENVATSQGGNSEDANVAHKAVFAYNYYYITSSWKRLKSTTVYSFDLSGNPLIDGYTEYFYESSNPKHQQVKTVLSSDNEGRKRKVQYIYPDDLEASWHNPTNRNLLKKAGQHRPATVLEQRSYAVLTEDDPSTPANETTEGLLVSASRTHYGTFTTNRLAPDSIEVYNRSSATYDTKILLPEYDSDGNLLQASNSKGHPTSYVYGYGNQLPVAQVINATKAEIEAKIGANPTIIDGLSSSQETLLRSIPGALVTTYTYYPLRGIASQTDPNGKTTTYIYDAAGRLRFVKDHDGNIVASNNYHYKGQD